MGLIILLILAGAYLRFFTYTGFKKTRFVFTESDFTAAGDRLTVSFTTGHDVPPGQEFILQLVAVRLPVVQKWKVVLNDRYFKEIEVRSGKGSGKINGVFPDSRNKLSIVFPEKPLQIHRMEIKNFYGFSTGLLHFFLLDKSTDRNRVMVHKWSGDILPLLVTAFFLILVFSKNKRMADCRTRPSVLVKYLLSGFFWLSLLFAAAPFIFLVLPLDYLMVLSQRTILFLCVGTLVCFSYAKGTALHSLVIGMVKNALRSVLVVPFRHGLDGKYALCVLLLPVLFFSSMVLVNLKFYCSPLMEMGDGAAYALQIERAKHFTEYLGPYSRFEFHHPGPINFYYYALAEKIFWFIPTPMGRHALAQVVLNFLFLLVALHIAYFSFSQKRASIVLFGCLLFVLAMPPFGQDVMARTWPPHLLIFPMVVFILASAMIAFGEVKYVLHATVSGIFILQNNVSSLAIVVPFILVTLALYLRNRKKHMLVTSRLERRFLWISAAIILIAFLPPLYEQFTARPGNITRIINFFSSQKGFQHGFVESLDYVLVYYKSPLFFWNMDAILVFLALWFFAVLLVRKSRDFWNYLILFLLLGFVLSVFGAMKISGELMHYILLYEVAFVILLYFAASCSLLNLIRLPAVNPKALFVFLGSAALLMAPSFFMKLPLQKQNQKIDLIVQALNPSRSVTYELFWRKGGLHHDQWVTATAVGLKMVRDGCRICVPEEWVFLFGSRMATGKQTGKVERVAFYVTDMRKGQVRKNAFTCQDTTIEFGDLIPLRLPVRLGVDAPDEYFENWYAAGKDFRNTEGPIAQITIPLGSLDVPPGRHCFIKIAAIGMQGKEYALKLNGQFLRDIVFVSNSVDEEISIADGLLRANTVNTISIQDLNWTGAPSESRPCFSLKSMEIYSK